MASRARVGLWGIGEFLDTDDPEGRKGGWFAIGRRTRWEFALHVPQISAGGSITLSVEVGPDTEEDNVRELVVFAAVTSAPKEIILNFDDTPPFTVRDGEMWMRGRVKAITGSAFIRLEAVAPWFSVADNADKQLLEKGLRDWVDGLKRTVDRAEEDVLEQVSRAISDRDWLEPTGTYWDMAINLPGAYEAIRSAIIRQAEWEYDTHRLRQGSDPSTLVTLRSRAAMSPDVARLLDIFRPKTSTVWRHR